MLSSTSTMTSWVFAPLSPPPLSDRADRPEQGSMEINGLGTGRFLSRGMPLRLRGVAENGRDEGEELDVRPIPARGARAREASDRPPPRSRNVRPDVRPAPKATPGGPILSDAIREAEEDLRDVLAAVPSLVPATGASGWLCAVAGRGGDRSEGAAPIRDEIVVSPKDGKEVGIEQMALWYLEGACGTDRPRGRSASSSAMPQTTRPASAWITSGRRAMQWGSSKGRSVGPTSSRAPWSCRWCWWTGTCRAPFPTRISQAVREGVGSRRDRRRRRRPCGRLARDHGDAERRREVEAPDDVRGKWLHPRLRHP